MDSPSLGITELESNTFHTGTDLHTAAVNGDKQTIERILKQQGDTQTLNKGDKYGRTALVYTVFGDWFECAEILVHYGASLLQVDSDKRSVFHWATYLDRPKFIRLFLEHLSSNLKCNFGDKDGRTALHYAAMQPNSKCLRLLLNRLILNKSNLNTTDNEQMTALHWSIFYNRLENFKLLVREGAETTKRDGKGRCLLHMAVLNPGADSVRIARILLKHNRHFSTMFDFKKHTSLHLAVANGNQELVRELCLAEESALNYVDHLSRSVLHYAVLKNDIELVNILISAGVSSCHVDSTGASILHYAAKNDNTQIVKRFLECFENYEDKSDNQGRTALMWAASQGSYDVLDLMLKNLSYFNIHASDEQGLTALHFACFAGHEKCVELLIANSADITQPDKLGQTALFKACQQGHLKIIDILMGRKGFRDTSRDNSGHIMTLMDNEGHQFNTRHGMLKDNGSTMGANLFSIQEETTISQDTLRNSEWSHELNDGGEKGERGNLSSIDKGAFSGDYTSDSLKPEMNDQQPIKHWIKESKTIDLTVIKHPRSNFAIELSSERLPGIDKLEDENGCTPLHFAAHAGHTAVCRWLLSQGVDPGKKDKQGRTALHGAAFNGYTECMVLMLSRDPGLVNDRDNDGYSVLHHAAINGELEAVKLLVSEPFQALLNYRVKTTDWTPLDFAMAADHQDVTQFLMDNGALTIAWLRDDAADKIKKFFRWVVLRKREATVKPLIERHEQLTKEENLKHCDENEDTMKNDDVTDDVMKDDVTYEKNINDVIHDDVIHEDSIDDVTHDDITKNAVIDDVTNCEVIDKKNCTVGCHGKEHVIQEETQEIKENKKGEADRWKDSMHSELKSENHSVTEDNNQLPENENTMHSDQNLDINWFTIDEDHLGISARLSGETEIYDNSKQILLLEACNQGDIERVQKLLQENLDVNYRDENGCTALHLAASQGQDAIFEYLLENGAELHMRDINGRTALHHAAIAGNIRTISLVLNHNKDLILYLDCDHRSALHYAASMGHLDAVKLLLSEDTRVKDVCAKSTPLTALDCAILGNHDDVIEYMTSQGLKTAQVNETDCCKRIERTGLLSMESHGKVIKSTNNKDLINNESKLKGGQNRDKAFKNTENSLLKNGDEPFKHAENGLLKNGDEPFKHAENGLLKNGDEPFKHAENGLTNNETRFKHGQKTMNTEYSVTKTDKPSTNGQDKRTLNDNSSKIKFNKTHDSMNERPSGIQRKSPYFTSKTDQNSRPTDCNPINRLSENFSEEINSETDYEFPRKETINPVTYSKHLPESRNISFAMRANSARSSATTFVQSNIENLSRAPESVIVASGEKDRIFQLRSNWERIALLRRKKQAALVIQKQFRKHLMTRKKTDDKNATKEGEMGTEIRDAHDVVKECAVISTKNIEETRHSGKDKNKNGMSLTGKTLITPNSSTELGKMPDKTFSLRNATGKTKDDNFSKSNKIQVSQNNVEKSSGINETTSPKRLTRKTVVNRLRTTSPEYISSENELSPDKRQYKSTFPLLSPNSSATSSSNQSVIQLPNNRRPSHSNTRVETPISPKSSSTSSNRSPSNATVNQLPGNRRANSSPSNRRVDVVPILSKNELVNQWLSDGLVSGNSMTNMKSTNKAKNAQAHATSNSEPRLRKTDSSKGTRRLSLQSARIRRDSLIMNAYGSPASFSYNRALDTYHPLASRRGRKDTAFSFRTSSRVRPNSMKRVEEGWVHTPDFAPRSTPSES